MRCHDNGNRGGRMPGRASPPGRRYSGRLPRNEEPVPGMLDINVIRTQPDRVRAAIVAKKAKADLDAVLAADEKWRKATTEAQRLQAEQNAANKDMGRLMKEDKPA